MPPGTEFDTVRADRVLVVVESQNECGGSACVPAPVGACERGAGNTRGLSVYRLGSTGLLFSAAGSSTGAVPEQLIATDDNPRRVVAHPNDPSLLYVATLRRIQVFRLAANGGSTCIDETLSDAEVAEDADDLDPIDLAIDPTEGTNGVLYVAGKGSSRIDAYDIALDGRIPDVPSSCIVGSTRAEFTAVAPVSSMHLATGGRDRIEIYERVGGQFPDVQQPTATPTESPETPVPTPSPSPDLEPVETPVPTPSPAPICIGARLVTTPISTLGASLVTDLEFLPSLARPAGDLLVAEELSLRLISFPVDPNGFIDNDDTGRTDRSGFYQRILRADRGGTTFFYASAFQEGKTDVYRLQDDGTIARDSISKTRADPFSLPVGLAIDGDTGPILYVAQEGLGRVDGFRIRADGGTDEVPATTTAPTRGADGAALDLFPDDVLIVPLP